MSEFKKNIKALREFLIKYVIVYILLFFISFNFWQDILKILSKPIKEKMIFTSLTEPFFTALKIASFSSLFLSIPFFIYFLWQFIMPALYKNEKKLFLIISISSIFMFLSGALFAYFIVFPIGFKLLIKFAGSNFLAMLKMSEYVSFSIKLLIAFGIAFELPVISFILTKLKIISYKDLISFSRYAVVITFIIAAILTPPDIFSQIAMAIPLLGLYALSIFISKIAG